ncbi:hypothetical protein [Candidatus Hecatella orcuttiae]|jgi:hypothetical protein|uniref:hypothetical protein n=1 Tax=Candidatus Hecatella orcuttiae TaxID=1935119 RepID=UPI002867E9CB|nr:hypothetical protein [Candidatus Hecatella orcuttiae]
MKLSIALTAAAFMFVLLFSPLPAAEGAEESLGALGFDSAETKTAITINVERIPKRSYLGESILIRGNVYPAMEGLELKIFYGYAKAGEETVESVIVFTDENGAFQFSMIPEEIGSLAFVVTHEGSDSTLPARAEPVATLVTQKVPIKPEQTFLPLILVAILLALWSRWDDIKELRGKGKATKKFEKWRK